MMMNNQNETEKPDWSQLAKEALDLWQNHLTSLASDPKAKEEMARLVAPMSQMVSDWTGMMQQGLQGMTEAAYAQSPSASSPPAEETQPETHTPEAHTHETQTQPETLIAAVPDEPVSHPEKQVEVPLEPQADTQSNMPEVVSVSEERGLYEAIVPASCQGAPERGRTIPPDSARNLAELAGRLAFLERELEGLRAKKRGDDTESESCESLQRVAGSHQGPTSD